MNEKRYEEAKKVTVSFSEAKRLTIQTEEKTDEEFEALIERIKSRNKNTTEPQK